LKYLFGLRKSTFIFLSHFFICFALQAQQNNNWYFGQRAGIRFSGTPGRVTPVTLTDGAMITDEGSAAFSDSNGQLLFYTNGITVFNRQHQVMLNGNDLKGNISSCQAAIIVPVPGNDSIYYIFTTDAIENNFSSGYNYSIVNMKRDNGNGEVVSKNTLLWQSCTERLTAARHQNGTDIWLITNDNNSNIFRSWLITCNGLQSNPVVSQAGVLLTQHLLTNTGYMKISPDGKQLCQTHFPLFDPDVSNPNFVQLFDFDNTTGQVTNGRSVMFDNAMYVACEYSSDSKMLYLVRPYERKIDQLEATLPSAAAVSASTISISTTSPVLTLQLAPNEKIYTFRPGQSLGVINYPAVKGAGCNFQDNQLDISPFSARFGSPSFINDVAYDPNNSFSYVITDSCSGRVQFTAISGMPGTLTWSWNFGDPASGANNTSTLQNPTHTFATAGTYNVTLSVITAPPLGCTNALPATIPVTINARPEAGFIIPEVCLSDTYAQFTDTSKLALPGIIDRWDWNFGDPGSGPLNTSTLQNPTHSYTAVGNYSVSLIVWNNAIGCRDTITQLLTVNGSFPVANFTVQNPATLCANDSVGIVDQSTVFPGVITKVEIYWDNIGQPGVFDIDNSPFFGKVYKHLYPNFQAPLTRNFSIRFRAYSGGVCVNDIIQVITVNAAPLVQFNNMPDTCFLAAPFQLTQATEIGGVPGTGIFSGPGVTPGGIFSPAIAGIGLHTIMYTFN